MIKENGQILVLVIAATGIVLFTVLFIIGGAQVYFQNSFYSVQAEKVTALAEAGIDKAINSLNKTGGAYNGETETVLGDGSYSVIVTNQDAANKLLNVTGYIPNKTNPKVKRTIKIQASKGVGIAFNYGLQVGEGGIIFNGGDTIVGSVYSNGSILGGGGDQITGDVWVAGGTQPVANQQQDCSGSSCTDFNFGTGSQIDVAQSFKPDTSAVLNKVILKLKKINNPSGNLEVRIMGNTGSGPGFPNKNDILGFGTISNDLVTGNYGWITVTLNASPGLTADATYWIMIHPTSVVAGKYWAWQEDLGQSYNRGQPEYSLSWNAHSPVWNPFNQDLSFQTLMGGLSTSFTGGITVKKDSQGYGGNVHANIIRNATIMAGAYYQSISDSQAASYFPNSEDPPPKSLPVSANNIQDWKDQATAGGITDGDITSCRNTFGPGKIMGNVTWDGCSLITVKSPIWITGTLSLKNNTTIQLDSSYGSISGVILVDGAVELKNSNRILGPSGGSGVLVLLSLYDSRTNGLPAIYIKNNGNTGVFYAPYGMIEIAQNNNLKEVTAWKIKFDGNSTITYDTGLADAVFSSGPSGSFSIVKGSYQVK